jgi:hypothetical protein
MGMEHKGHTNLGLRWWFENGFQFAVGYRYEEITGWIHWPGTMLKMVNGGLSRDYYHHSPFELGLVLEMIYVLLMTLHLYRTA